LLKLASLNTRRGAFTDALIQYDELVARFSDALGGDREHDDFVPILMLKGDCFVAMGDVDGGIKCFNEALRIRMAFYDEPHTTLVEIMYRISDLCVVQERWQEAYALEEQAMDALRKLYGDPSLELCDAHGRIAGIHEKEGALHVALTLLTKSYQQRKDLLGAGHLSLCTPLRRIAALYQATDSDAKALHCYNESLKIEISDEKDMRVQVRTYQDAALDFIKQGKVEWAVDCLDAATKIAVSAYTETSVLVVSLYADYGDTLMVNPTKINKKRAKARYEAGIKLLDSVMKERKKPAYDPHLDTKLMCDDDAVALATRLRSGLASAKKWKYG
jgi:tetratricopeptide (TPR) repeat protein